MRFSPTHRVWTLFWFDRNSAAHRCPDAPSTATVADLLRVVDRDPTGIFWG